MPERDCIKWLLSTGHNAPLWKASPARLRVLGCFAIRVLPVATVIENLEDLSVDAVMEQFDVRREPILAVLEFVAQSSFRKSSSDAPICLLRFFIL